MQKTATRLVSLIALLVTCGAGETLPGAAGHWEGKLQMPERELGIRLDLARNSSGGWIGTISILGSTAADVPLTDLTVQDTAVKFAAYLPDYASFEGDLSQDHNGLSGKASNALGEVPFELARRGEADVKLPPPSSVLSKEFDGVWEGPVAADGKTLRVRLKLASSAGGIATAVLISVDQGNQEIPVTTVTIEGKQLRVEARSVSGLYRGTLGEGGEIAGEWSQGHAQLPLTLKRVARP